MLHEVPDEALASLRHDLLVLQPELLNHRVLRAERDLIYRRKTLPSAIVYFSAGVVLVLTNEAIP